MCRRAKRRFALLWRVLGAALRARSVCAFYDALAPVYEEVFTDHLVHIDTIARLLEGRYSDRESCMVLDLACGTGLLSRRLAQEGFTLVGLDLSARSLEILRQKGERIPLVCGSAESLPFADHSLNAVVCLGAWRHFDRPEAVLHEIRRVLVPNGDVIIGYFPPKLGAFVTVAPSLFGRLIGRLYMRITEHLGYIDRVDREHEEATIEVLMGHFEQLSIIPSGSHGHLLSAHTPCYHHSSNPTESRDLMRHEAP